MRLTRRMENGKMVYRKDGVKLYPICRWTENQHKIYNAHDRALNWCYDSEWSEEAVAELERVEKMLWIIDGIVIEGLVYGTWEEYKLIKDCITAYDVRHDMMA